MSKEYVKRNKLDFKVIVFWFSILVITVLFGVLFAIKIHDTKIFDSYEDINTAKLNLVYDITSEEGEYFVYIYSAKKNSEGKLVDGSKTDISKANEVLPTVFNYFNYVRRNERALEGTSGFCKIYGYNAKASKDSVLTDLGLKIDQLPALVKVENGSPSDVFTKANDIQKQLSQLMK